MKTYSLFFLTVLAITLVAPAGVLAQDMNYSQYFSAPMYYNPGYTGINPGLKARFLYRNQWPSLPVSLKSYFFSAELGDRSLPGSGGIGLIINQDSPGYGLISNFAASLSVGIRVPINETFLAEFGIKAGIIERRINWDDLVFPSQLDPRLGITSPTMYSSTDPNKRIVPDFGAGGVIQFKDQVDILSGNIGLSVDHLFQPDVSFLSSNVSPYPRKYVGQFEMLINTEGRQGSRSSGKFSGGDDPLMFNLGAIYQNQAALGALQAGFTALKYNIYAGAWYKTTFGETPNSSLALVAGYRFYFYENMNVKAMYSYDIQISKAMQGTGGAHEISVVIDLADVMLFGGGSGGFRGGGIPGGRSSGHGAMECPAFY